MKTIPKAFRSSPILFTLAVLLWLAPLVARAQFNYVIDNGTITITGYVGPGSVVTIPDTVDGLPVTTIGNDTFVGRNSLTSVAIPSSVTCIGECAFSGCTRLNSITVPNSVTNIGSAAFWGCISLTSVTLPDSITTVGWAAFGGCASLSAITVDAGNPFYSSLDGVLFDQSQRALLQCPGGKAGSYKIPTSVTSIASGAFEDCIRLTSVIIGNGVTNLPFNSALSTGPFGGCTRLTEITVEAGNPYYGSADGVLFNSNQTIILECPEGRNGNYTIPKSVTTIGDGAFYSCRNLANVTIGNNVRSIGVSAFQGCAGLSSVTIPDSVTTILPGAFLDCTGLSGLTIPNSVTNIGGDYFFIDTRGAFEGCVGLRHVTIPGSVTSLGIGAFDRCTALTNVTMESGVVTIGDYAFYDCDSLITVTIPDSVTSIGQQAFCHSSALASIAVDPRNRVYSSLDGVLFDKGQTRLIQCPGAKAGSYLIPHSVTSIGDGAFAGCDLSNIILPNSVTSIGNSAFSDCDSLTSITIPNGVTRIGYSAFCDCNSLASITIPKSVIAIRQSAFSDCTRLTTVCFEGNALALEDENVFEGVPNATIYYLPGTAGWDVTFGWCPTAPWSLPNPTILSFGPSFGVHSNQLGFIISWATNASVAVEAATRLTKPDWKPIATNTITMGADPATDGWSYFTDRDWSNHPARFYRVRSQ